MAPVCFPFEGVVTQFIYDDAAGAGGRLSEQRYFTNLTAYDSGNGTPSETTTYNYDAFGRPVSVTQDDGTTRVTASTYDAEGRMQVVSSPEGVIAYEYDALGRKTATKVFAIGADPAVAVPERVTVYTYDALSRLATVVEDLDPASSMDTPLETEYGYDLLGRLDQTALPNGVIEDYVYDSLQRLDKLTHYAPDGTPEDLSNNPKLAEFDYTVRDDGKRTGVNETFWLDADSNGTPETHANQIAWTYDDVGRLTDEVFNHFDDTLDQTEHFVYDLVGNRVEKTKDAGNNSTVDEAISYLFDDNDRLTTESLDQGNNASIEQTTTYGWNATQQASKTVVDASSVTQSAITYSYHLQGRMAQVVTETSTSGVLSRRERVTYDYDATGMRVSSLVEIDANVDSTYESRVRTDYLFDQQNFTGYPQVIKETFTDVATSLVQKTIEYTYGHDEIAQTVTEYDAFGAVTSMVTHAFGRDGHGSVRVLFDATAALTQLNSFDAYGTLLGIHLDDASFLSASSADALTSLLYSGERFDTNVQLQYLRARFYDASTGRFDRLDPFAGNANDPRSLHKYGYVHGDPILGSDPTGLSTWPADLGKVVHKMIYDLYRASFPFNQILQLGVSLPLSAGALFPDIMDFSLGQIAEVKPLSLYGITTGFAQLNAYVMAANGMHVSWRGTSTQLLTAVPHAGPQPFWIPSTWPVGVRVLLPGSYDAVFAKTVVFTIGNINGVVFYKHFQLPMNTLKLATVLSYAEQLEKILQAALAGIRIETAEDLPIADYVTDTALYLGIAMGLGSGGVLVTRAARNMQLSATSALSGSPISVVAVI